MNRWRWLGWVRPQDLVWLLLFSAMAAILTYSRVHNTPALVLLFCLGIFQVAESKTPVLVSRRGSLLAVFVKLLLGYLLIGFTGGLSSSYYLVLLLPVVSAATSFGGFGTLVFTVLASASYLSFLLFVDWRRQYIPPDQVAELAVRVAFLAVVGYLTHTLAAAHREEARKAQAVAGQLAEANRSLQEAEAAVRRSERLAALGQMSAGLAHELRNPLGTIRGSAEMLAKKVLQHDEVARELAGLISSEVDRTNSLITRFLEFARPLELRPAVADLAEVIDRAVAQLERGAPRPDISVYTNYSPDIPPFAFDPELLERAVYNLLLNAAQSSPPGGAVTVKTRPLDASVEIAVIDRGSGIDPKHLESIFNPFFTTKPDGVGLGLAIVSKIVDLHGGRMAVESEPGKGSVFRIFLPAGAVG